MERTMHKASAMQYLVLDANSKGELPVRDSTERAGEQMNNQNSERIPGFESHDSDAPRFVVLLAELPADGLIRIPIAVTGNWKGAEKKFSVGLDDLEEIRSNFAKKPTGEINVDYEHASEVPFGTGGPVLSAGRIVRLDEPEEYGIPNSESRSPESAIRNPKFILWGWFEPTERARELIANKEYRYISPAIRWGARDKVSGKNIGTVLTSVALVNKPFLEDMPQIQAGGQMAEEQAGGQWAVGSGKTLPAYLPASPSAHLATSPSACFTETLGEQKVFVSLGQLHVPGPMNQFSLAYGQPANQKSEAPDNQGPMDPIGQKSERSKNSGGKQMAAKSLKLKRLTAADIETHGLPASDEGKIGVFDGAEPIGTAEPPEGWQAPGGPSPEGGSEPEDEGSEQEGEDEEACDPTASEATGVTAHGHAPLQQFASEVGMPGKSLPEITAAVKRGVDAGRSPASAFAALSEAIHDGHINVAEAGRLADAGKVRFSTVLQAQEAERKVDAAVKAGRVLPKHRAHALKLALSDSAGFAALIEQARPVVDLHTHGHAGGGEQPTAQQSLMAEVNAYAKMNNCSVSAALSEVTKRQPNLWSEYSEEIVTAVDAEAAEEE